MKGMIGSRQLISVGAAVALLAGCGGSQLPIGAPGAMPQAVDDDSSSFRVLHRFGLTYGGGVHPQSALLNVNGTLYGTTLETSPCHRDRCGYGTVFSVTAAGVKTTLYRFKGGASDGAYPAAPLIDVDGTLYGTTLEGGGPGCNGDGCGTVFSISTSGSEKTLYSFQGGSDGANPESALSEVDGTLYGTTLFGGGYSNCGSGSSTGCGTVYSIDLSGSESVLHAFQGIPDGAEPDTSLADVSGTLYGVTSQGGVSCGDSTVSFPDGCGTVYRITTSGSETVLHRFKGQADGRFPTGGLLDVHGLLYGTTGALVYDRGSVYKFSTDGTLTTLYRFQALPDAAVPNGGLISAKGMLYGTSFEGGTACMTTSAFGCGTVFSVTTSGKEAVLHRFASKSSGLYPMAGLTYLKGRLYGTTSDGGHVGGRHCYLGCGIAFVLTP
jgi:uncharacterized repeat protein (TIGR03803 family)